MKNRLVRTLVTLYTLAVASFSSSAQVTVGADVVSRYVWRGVDFGNSPGFQPAIGYTTGSLSIGTWGSYSFAGTGTAFSEHDLWASYSFATPPGTFTVLFTDY